MTKKKLYGETTSHREFLTEEKPKRSVSDSIAIRFLINAILFMCGLMIGYVFGIKGC